MLRDHDSGPIETPDLDLGPEFVPGIGSDHALQVPPGMDPLEFDDPTGGDGQPDSQGAPDAGGSTAPETGTPPTPPLPADADTTARPWEGQHPDMLDPTSMTDEQWAEFAQADPAAARRYALRQAAFTKKTEELAQLRRSLEERENALLEAQREQQQSGVQTQQGTQQGADESFDWMQRNGMGLYKELGERLGREPNYVEFMSFAAHRAAGQEAQPLAQRVDATARDFQQQQQRVLAQALKTEFDSLIDQKPQASAPDRVQAVYEYLERNPNMLQDGSPITRAYNALFADVDGAAQVAGQQHARRQQAATSQQTPATPPSGY